MTDVIKDLGSIRLLEIECSNLGDYKRCKLYLGEPFDKITFTEKVDDVEVYDVDSVGTEGNKTRFLILDTVRCRVEKGDGITRNPDKKYLICGKDITEWGESNGRL